MWSRTFVGFFLGLLLSISLMLNLNFILPLAVDSRLLIGLLAAFVLWAAVMVYCYYSKSAGRAGLGCMKLLVVSGVVNAALMFGPFAAGA